MKSLELLILATVTILNFLKILVISTYVMQLRVLDSKPLLNKTPSLIKNHEDFLLIFIISERFKGINGVEGNSYRAISNSDLLNNKYSHSWRSPGYSHNLFAS